MAEMKSLRGHFLVASPHLTDPNFFQTVVLMIQHDEEGAFGLVLNRPTTGNLRELWEQLEEPCEADRPIHFGGPVEGPLMALHADELCAEEEVIEGVYFAVRKESICEVVKNAAAPFLVFTGYSGWGGGQLEDELEAGGWLVAPATRDDIFGDIGELWTQVSQRIGLEILQDALRPKHVPDDPQCN
jgi:putative transcriptional regulator